MLKQFYNFLDDQYEKYIRNEFGKEYDFFDEVYARLGKNFSQRYEIKDIIEKENEIKKVYDICNKNINELIKTIRSLVKEENYYNDYKKWKLDQEEPLEQNWKYSDDFYSYYNETYDTLWNDLIENSEYSEIFTYMKDFRDTDDLLRKLKTLSEEIDNVYTKLSEFFLFKEFNKNQFIEYVFDDIEIDYVY